MKKLLSTLLISTFVFGGAQAVSADTDIVAKTDADIAVKGTLGADNTDPDTTIPEGDKEWINVTVPTETIFYNKATAKDIKSPTYEITNKSGRPVKVSVAAFTADAANPATLPADFGLNLDAAGGNLATTASTKLIDAGALLTPTNEVFTLANSVDQFTAADPVATGAAVNNKGTFSYSGTATTSTALKLSYTLSLRFDSVAF